MFTSNIKTKLIRIAVSVGIALLFLLGLYRSGMKAGRQEQKLKALEKSNEMLKVDRLDDRSDLEQRLRNSGF